MSFNIKAPTLIDPSDYERDGSGGIALQPAPAVTVYPKSSDADRLPDPRGTWEETFFFSAGELMLTPELPRRGAAFLIVHVDRGSDTTAAGVRIRVRGANPNAAAVTLDTLTTATTGMVARVYGPGAATSPFQGTSYQVPIPPAFRIGFETASGPMKAPAGGAWLRVQGIGGARAYAVPEGMVE